MPLTPPCLWPSQAAEAARLASSEREAASARHAAALATLGAEKDEAFRSAVGQLEQTAAVQEGKRRDAELECETTLAT